MAQERLPHPAKDTFRDNEAANTFNTLDQSKRHDPRCKSTYSA